MININNFKPGLNVHECLSVDVLRMFVPNYQHDHVCQRGLLSFLGVLVRPVCHLVQLGHLQVR